MVSSGALGLSHSSSRWDSGIAVSAWLCSGSPVVLLGTGAATVESASIVVLLETGIVVLGCECESPRRIIAFVVLLETGIVVLDSESPRRIVAFVMME